MPIMDGFEMMRYLRQSPQGKMAIIASSVDVFETDIHENLKGGSRCVFTEACTGETPARTIGQAFAARVDLSI